LWISRKVRRGGAETRERGEGGRGGGGEAGSGPWRILPSVPDLILELDPRGASQRGRWAPASRPSPATRGTSFSWRDTPHRITLYIQHRLIIHTQYTVYTVHCTQRLSKQVSSLSFMVIAVNELSHLCGVVPRILYAYCIHAWHLSIYFTTEIIFENHDCVLKFNILFNETQNFPCTFSRRSK
jgi:hypothetical protein